MQMCPTWCSSHLDCWTAIVDTWLSDEHYEKHATRRDCRLQMAGAPHHQGNLNLSAYAERWVHTLTLASNLINCNHSHYLKLCFLFFSQSRSHDNEPCNEFMAYNLAHKGKASASDNRYNPADGPDAYTNAAVYPKIAEYTAKARERHGEDYDPATEPLDTDLLMRLGGGKQHGRYFMADSAIEPGSVPPPPLAEIRASSTSSSVPIRPRQATTQQQMAALQVSTEPLRRPLHP